MPEGLNDSKRLTAKHREKLEEIIKKEAISYSISQVEADEIDRINILRATKKAMRQAIEKLSPQPDFVLIDALTVEDLQIPQKGIISGDAISASIAAASILAKVYRDRLMKKIDKIYPVYGFGKNAGYATKKHLEALRTYGPCPIHRKSFRPVSQSSLF